MRGQRAARGRSQIPGRLLQVLCFVTLLGCNEPVQPELEFSEVRVEELTPLRAVVRFRTSRPASCEVELGTNPARLDLTFTDPSMAPGQLVTEHQVPLENLAGGREYYFRAKARDAAGATFRSEVSIFATPLDATTSTLVNVALLSAGTTVVAVSSNFGGGSNDSAFGAARAFDGDFTTEWATNGDGDAAFIEIDFGQLRPVARWGFRSRSMRDMDDESASITSVLLSLDGAAPLGPFDTWDSTRFFVFELPEGTTARRARVSSVTTTGGNTGAKEIQFFSP